MRLEKLTLLRFAIKGVPLFLLALFLVILCFPLTAQTDTTLFFPEIEIKASRPELFGPGQYTQEFTDTSLRESPANVLSDVLIFQTGVAIKTYGQGGLATPGARGTGASHTAILWNGFNLQNSMNGVADLALLPLDLTDRIVVQYGGASALFGSGALGGAIHLTDQDSPANGLHGKLETGFGSFRDLRQSGEITFVKSPVSSKIKFYHQTAQNNFPIRNASRTRQSNAEMEHLGFTNYNSFSLKENQKISTHFWWQKASRHIPPSITEGNSDAKQEDDILRAAIDWELLGNKAAIKVRSAFFEEHLLFFSSLVDSSQSHTQSLFLEGETSFTPASGHLFNIGAHFGYFQADANAFDTKKMRRLLALFFSYRFHLSKKWQFISNIRQEWADNSLAPFTASLGVLAQLNRQLSVRSQLSKNYRLPNFNDLYWPGAGNPDLRSETGWNQELGLDYHRNYQNGSWKSSFTAFSILVDNWILWAPTAAGLWTPQNKRKVWSRGLEYKLNAGYNWGKWEFRGALSYDLTAATVQKTYDDLEAITKGKQLIYIPLHKAAVFLKAGFQNWSAQYQQFLYGRRFTTPDNTHSLPAISAGDLSLIWSRPSGRFKPVIQFTIHNIWNADYQLIAWRPMPLRHVQLRIGCEW